MRFGMWNVRSLHRAGSLTTAARELARYKLDLVGVQEETEYFQTDNWKSEFTLVY